MRYQMGVHGGLDDGGAAPLHGPGPRLPLGGAGEEREREREPVVDKKQRGYLGTRTQKKVTRVKKW